jgi:CxxC motif-containing protein (DUF1111 family)
MLPAKRILLLLPAAALAVVWAGIAQEQSATPAPTGFTTPSFNGPASPPNEIPEPEAGDTYTLDQQIFERNHQVQSADHTMTGLGPVYNGTACVTCHENPNTGGQSQITEIRAGHNENGVFVNATITLSDAQKTQIQNRSIVNDRAICPEAEEHLPATENIRTLRSVLNTLGDGYVEAIGDQTLMNIAAKEIKDTHGRIHGQALEVPLFESANTRVGRFGWKDQHGSILSFAADAYVNEVGVTSRLRQAKIVPDTVCPNLSADTNPEDIPDQFGMADIDHFAQFIRGTMPPPRDETLMKTDAAIHGEHLFAVIGCRTCHMDSITTGKPGTQIITVTPGTPAGTLGTYTIPEQLGNKIIHPYSDFLLHDIGTGDGIVQTTGHQETANELRTAPLWGLRTHSRFMHDLKSLSLEDAIARHKGEAQEESDRFRDLLEGDREDLITFLKSL